MHPSQNNEEERQVANLLHALNQARPAPGLETRLMQRLSAEVEQSAMRRSRRWGKLTLAMPAAAAACVVCAFFVHHQRSAVPPAASPVLHASTRAQPYSAATASQAHLPAFSGASAVPHAGHSQVAHPEESVTLHALRRSSPQQPGQGESPQYEASFPAPEMPLTEQERLLLQIAHRNDPVQVALLDQHERNLILARERAESKQFFAPRPLPPDLQQEIDAAVQSQYTVDETTQDRIKP